MRCMTGEPLEIPSFLDKPRRTLEGCHDMYGERSVINFGPRQRWSANGGSKVNLNLSTD